MWAGLVHSHYFKFCKKRMDGGRVNVFSDKETGSKVAAIWKRLWRLSRWRLKGENEVKIHFLFSQTLPKLQAILLLCAWKKMEKKKKQLPANDKDHH